MGTVLYLSSVDPVVSLHNSSCIISVSYSLNHIFKTSMSFVFAHVYATFMMIIYGEIKDISLQNCPLGASVANSDPE